MIEKNFEPAGQTKIDPRFEIEIEIENEKKELILSERKPNKEQQFNIAFAFKDGSFDSDSFFLPKEEKQKSIEEISEEEIKEHFLNRLTKGEITDEHFKKLIQEIETPFQNEKRLPRLYENIILDRQIKDIIFEIILKDDMRKEKMKETQEKSPDVFDSLITQESIEFLFETYPNPIIFEEKLENYLSLFWEEIEKKQSAGKKQDYQISLIKLKKIIYGKQQEYWNQIKLLKKEAKKKNNKDK